MSTKVFWGSGGFVPAVAGECPAVEVAALEVEENDVGVRRLGECDGGEGGRGENETGEAKKVRSAGHWQGSPI